MKYLPFALLITAAVLTGCGKKQETPSSVTAAEEKAPVVEETVASAEKAPAEAPKTTMTSSLVAEAEETVKAVMPEVKEAAMAVASSVDWANLSWNDVSSVPYDDKDQLVAWAAPQIEALKDQLTKAVKDKGLAGLASLGDSGWQGALKKTVDALDPVRPSSPETWGLARGALTSAWQTLQTEAEKYLN